MDGTTTPVAPERRGRPHHGAQVPRVGHAVKCATMSGRGRTSPHREGPRGARVLVGTHPQGHALVDRAAGEPVRSSLSPASSTAIPDSAASCTDSATRSSSWARPATYSAIAGIPARSDSTTELRLPPWPPAPPSAAAPWRRVLPRGVNACAAVSAPPAAPLPGPALGRGRPGRRPLRWMAGPHARRRRRPLALKLVATVAARARARLTPLAVAATARRPAVLATFFVPAHSSSAKFITFVAPARSSRPPPRAGARPDRRPGRRSRSEHREPGPHRFPAGRPLSRFPCLERSCHRALWRAPRRERRHPPRSSFITPVCRHTPRRAEIVPFPYQHRYRGLRVTGEITHEGPDRDPPGKWNGTLR